MDAVILISAMTKDRVIGKSNGLPWNIPEEYQLFLGHVRGQAVIFGRKSFEIFGPDLPDSYLFVVSRSATALPGARVFETVDAAIEAARATGRTVFCAGGATLYALTLPVADALYLSIIKSAYEGDTYFPIFDETAWRITRCENHPKFEFRVYQR